MNRTGIVILASALLVMPPAHAESEHTSMKDTAGLGIGAVFGALIGGPIGAIAGAAGGAWLGGREAERDLERMELARELADREDRLAELHNQLADLQQQSAAGLQPVHLEQRPRNIEQLSEALRVAVYFRTDSAALEPDAIRQLERLAGYLSEYPELRVHLSGHADRRGPADYNRALSQRRAESVRTVLRNAGLDGHRITIQAHGASRASAAMGDIESYIFDRQVVLELSMTEPV